MLADSPRYSGDLQDSLRFMPACTGCAVDVVRSVSYQKVAMGSHRVGVNRARAYVGTHVGDI